MIVSYILTIHVHDILCSTANIGSLFQMDLLVITLPDNDDDDEIRDLLNKWYRLDTNAIPAEYVLQPISIEIPEFMTTTGT